ncbi:hypothetical protein [Paenibacillus sp. AN1007]|jgi:hypothetical protein|uniref:DUF4190 domain-containing protein n=1 Tax=Paenibacillus sp. AN1007 TaxID=3151385 RepID=A0AAU8NCZ9_9BACL
MIIMAVLFIGTGLMFLVYPQKTAGDADRQVRNRRAAAGWIGTALIVMSCLFLVMGTMQLFDQSSHHMGH